MYGLYTNSTGFNNVALGNSALFNSSTGYMNTALGASALEGNTTGYRNTALGSSAGRYITGGSVANQTSNTSLYLGADTRALASGDTNEMVIGYNLTGLGSNTVVLGNDSITKTALKGNVGIGTTDPTGKLHVVGAVTGKALAIFDETGDQALFTASASGTTKFVIDHAGNVGVGVSIPTAALDVSSATYPVARLTRTTTGTTNGYSSLQLLAQTTSDMVDTFATAMRFSIQDDTSGIQDIGTIYAERYGADNSGRLAIGTANAGVMNQFLFLTPNQNVGIGNSVPVGKLDVSGAVTGKALAIFNETGDQALFTASAAGVPKFTIQNDGDVVMANNTALFFRNSTNTADALVLTNTAGDNTQLYGDYNINLIANDGAIKFDTGWDERMVITNSGNVGIGSTVPESKLQVTGGGLCVGSDANCNTDNNTEGVVYSSSTSMTVYDVAENYPTKDSTLTAQEIVELDPDNGVFVKRASTPYSRKLLGVISEKPAVLLGGQRIE